MSRYPSRTDSDAMARTAREAVNQMTEEEFERAEQIINVKPITSRVLVRPIHPQDGPIIIPEKYRLEREEEPIEAEVVILGHQNRTKRGREIPWTVKPGDRVLVVDFMGAEVIIGDQRHLVVKESDVLAILACPLCDGMAYTTSPRHGATSCLYCNQGIREAERKNGRDNPFLATREQLTTQAADAFMRSQQTATTAKPRTIEERRRSLDEMVATGKITQKQAAMIDIREPTEKERQIANSLADRLRDTRGLWCNTHRCEADDPASCHSAWKRQGIKGGITLPCEIVRR